MGDRDTGTLGQGGTAPSLTYQQSQVIDGETLENVGEAWLEVNRLVVEDKNTENVP